MSNQTNIFRALARASLLIGASLQGTTLHAAEIEEIIVTADFRENTLMNSQPAFRSSTRIRSSVVLPTSWKKSSI